MGSLSVCEAAWRGVKSPSGCRPVQALGYSPPLGFNPTGASFVPWRTGWCPATGAMRRLRHFAPASLWGGGGWVALAVRSYLPQGTGLVWWAHWQGIGSLSCTAERGARAPFLALWSVSRMSPLPIELDARTKK